MSSSLQTPVLVSLQTLAVEVLLLEIDDSWRDGSGLLEVRGIDGHHLEWSTTNQPEVKPKSLKGKAADKNSLLWALLLLLLDLCCLCVLSLNLLL